uniref:Putative targeting complex trapp subunit n=1 Tax=Ornithodoros turicata TaxID=34597 RepID=A0A2R5L9E5_9ACAR
MSFVDYDSRIEDHQCLLVLVKAIGPHTGSKLFGRVLERISRVRHTRHSQLGGRTVWLRYVKSYPTDASEWGDFQAHRRVLGLITVGKCQDQSGMEQLCHLHMSLQQQYPTAIDSRCLLFGMDTPSSPTDSSCTEDHDSSPEHSKWDMKVVSPLQGGDGALTNGYSPFTGKLRSTQCLVYPSLGQCEKLEHDVEDFAASLVWVLESRRLDRSLEKQDRCPLLKAPFESRDFVGLDTESRTFKKRCQGHLRKQVGDLSLQLGLPLEALVLYSEAADLLKGVPDWLWLAATYEAQVAASVALQYPGIATGALHRNASFPRTARTGVLQQQQSRSLPNGTEATEYKTAGRFLLTLEEMIERLKECSLHYSKYSHAAVIQMECNIKATRLLAQREKYLMASQFLQNATFMSIPLSRAEKVEWYASMARLYTEIGFHRKAAFHMRVAAIKYSSLQEGDAQQCYDLLLKCLEGFKIILDPSKVAKSKFNGWPQLHIQVLSDLIFTAKKMLNYPVAIRHTTFLLETMLYHLSCTEQKEVCSQLVELASQCEVIVPSGPLALPCGVLLPPVNLLHIPLVRSLVAQCPASQLRPQHKGVSVTDSPFIFSPHQRKGRRKTAGKMDFDWVQGEVCAVSMQLYNPLPVELRIQEMSLLVDGVPFECFPSSLELPAESSPYPVKLLGIARAAGELHILGYSTRVFGVTSHCRLRDLSWVRCANLSVEVVPALPQLEVTSSLPLATSFSTLGANIISNYALVLYAGESQVCQLTLTNPSSEPIESVEVSLLTKLEREWETFSWESEALWQQLPIAPHGGTAILTLQVHGQYAGTQGCTDTSKVLEAVVQLRYSGGPGLRAKYYRQCGISLSVEVLPSVLITKWDVLPAQVASQCYLVLDVLNGTEHEMELSYPEQKRMLIEPHDSCRIPVTVDRCPPPPAEPSSLALLEEACCAHLVDSVHLRWYLHGVEKNGKASITEIAWTPRMLDTILLSPLQWDISINNQPYRVEEEYVCTVGEPLSLNIIISNISEMSLRKLYLSIDGYQDRQNGTLSYRLDSKCALVGCDKVFIQELGPQEAYDHDFSMAFFLTGAYKLDLSCRTLDFQSLGSLSALAHNEGEATHIWKCSPSIQVMIVEEQSW